jgi:hypothetical protein
MADAAAEAAEAAAASEVRSKFFGDELATVSHANFLATIAKLRYKQGGGASDGAAPATSTSTGPDAGPAAKALGAGAAVAQPQELRPTVAVMAAASASSSSSSTSSVVDRDDGEDDFAADPQFKRPPAVAPKGRKTRVRPSDSVIHLFINYLFSSLFIANRGWSHVEGEETELR